MAWRLSSVPYRISQLPLKPLILLALALEAPAAKIEQFGILSTLDFALVKLNCRSILNFNLAWSELASFSWYSLCTHHVGVVANTWLMAVHIGQIWQASITQTVSWKPQSRGGHTDRSTYSHIWTLPVRYPHWVPTEFGRNAVVAFGTCKGTHTPLTV